MTGSDIPSIAAIVLTTWEMDSYGEEIAIPSSEAYVASCFLSASSAYVAEEDGKVIGCVTFTVGRGIIRAICSSIRMKRIDLHLRHLEGYDRFRSDMDVIISTDEELRRMAGRTDSQLILLIVSEDMRGRGIGRMLYEHALEEMRRNGCRSVLIFTDDDCGYSFYERDGCEKMGEMTVRLVSEDLMMMAFVKSLIVK